jgi:cobalt/nickel transport system ATP-binding protein
VKASSIEIKDVSFEYNTKTPVLANCSLAIDKGTRTGIVGSNGAGKTTLFQLICGVLQVNSGQIMIDGIPVRTGFFNPSVGFVFQNPDDQLFCISVLEDIMFGPLNMGLSFKQAREKGLELLTRVGLAHLQDRPPHHLSFGEKRMVAIASVLSMQPGLLILDEPTSNLDSRARRLLIGFLQALDITVLIASHDLEFLLETCDDAVLMHDGQIITTGQVRSVFSDEGAMQTCHQEMPLSLSRNKG